MIIDKQEIIEKQINIEEDSYADITGHGMFFIDLITAVSEYFLTIKNKVIYCRYESLLLWRDYTMKIESDLIIACYCASYSLKHSNFETAFNWKNCIDHDNEKLNSILRRGLTDNHYHLGGSLPIFQSTWNAIMKDKSFRNRIKDVLKYSGEIQLDRAAYLRDRLIKFLISVGIEINRKDNESVLNSKLYYEEREFMYNIFRILNNGKSQYGFYGDLFYEYIIIKNKFRNVLVEQDYNYGMVDFISIIDNRNKILSACGNIDGIIKSGINESLKAGNINRIEIRIKMQPAIYLNHCIDVINTQRDNSFSHVNIKYIISFSKRKVEGGTTFYRDQLKRDALRKELNQLLLYLEDYPSIAKTIAGIDVSSREDYYSPEVFSEIMKKMVGFKNGILKRMYHVGEHFTDLLTGLRRVDECLVYFNLKTDDRLAHAVPIYENVKQWYCGRNYHIKITKEEYIDNLSWLFCNLPLDLQATNEANIIKRVFTDLFVELYTDAFDAFYLQQITRINSLEIKINEISITHYYEAWKLRSKSPEAIFEVIQTEGISHDELIVYLIAYSYFFNKSIKQRGQQVIELIVSPDLIELVEIIQGIVQQEIIDRGVCIEICPSSNRALESVSKSQGHPILNLYEKSKENLTIRNICFSLNTDDMDIFSTSLPNEYSLIANSYEMNRQKFHETDSDCMDFYKWLDSIRCNSNKM